jgi:hypothetical protein
MWCVGLLRDTIILDTVCLSEAAKRVTPKDRHILHTILSKVMQTLPMIVNVSVEDPEPDPQDPHFFWASRIRIH